MPPPTARRHGAAILDQPARQRRLYLVAGSTDRAPRGSGGDPVGVPTTPRVRWCWTATSKLGMAIAAALLGLAIVGAVGGLGLTGLLGAQQELLAHLAAVDTADDLLLQVELVRSELLGYVATGQMSYLDDMQQAAAQARTQQQQLLALIADDPALQAPAAIVRADLDAYLAEAERVTTVRSDLGAAAALARLDDGRLTALGGTVRAALAEIRADERSDRDVVVEAAARVGTRATWLIVLVTLAVAAAVWLVAPEGRESGGRGRRWRHHREGRV